MPRRSPPPRSVSRIVIRVLVLVMLILGLVLGATAFRVWQVARIDDRRQANAIVVLGAAQYNGIPTPVFQARLEHAAMLFQEGVAPEIITVGGNQPGDAYTEAGSGRTYLAGLGVPGANILAVETGSNTNRSIEAVAKTVKDQGGSSIVIVSDPTHSFRARLMARDSGLSAWTSPTRHGPAVWTRENQLSNIVRETGALVWYQYQRLVGNDADLPG